MALRDNKTIVYRSVRRTQYLPTSKIFLNSYSFIGHVLSMDFFDYILVVKCFDAFKNHFVAGLSTVFKSFPLQLWCALLQQTELTLNFLRTSHINTKLSAYAVLKGQFNFNKTPLAPPGTKALV